MKFLIQPDFKNESIITLQRAQDYHQWKNDGKNLFEISFEKCVHQQCNPKEWCPVGSIEFVHNYYEEHFGLEFKPINVPKELFPFAGRLIQNINSENRNVFEPNTFFVKSNDIIKCEHNGWYNFAEIMGNSLPKGNYQVSEIIDIKSEYRCFIYQGQLLGIHFYQGDYWKYPDQYTINKMIEAYKNCPTVYTLDIAIAYTDDKPATNQTVILEVHDFYSCGLYGFQNLEKLPFMYWRSHLDKIHKIHKIHKI